MFSPLSLRLGLPQTQITLGLGLRLYLSMSHDSFNLINKQKSYPIQFLIFYHSLAQTLTLSRSLSVALAATSRQSPSLLFFVSLRR